MRQTEQESLRAQLADLQAIIDRMQDSMNRLLLMVAESRSRCRACKKEIWWIRTKLGKMSPHDWDGVSHFATCVFAEKFRKLTAEEQQRGEMNG